MKITGKIKWERKSTDSFVQGKYSRVHQWEFDGGMKLSASASPEIVKEPLSDPALIDPEEAFITSISSCHMLFFLSFAAKQKIIIDNYEDYPEAVMGKNDDGKIAILSITLSPKIIFGGNNIPNEEMLKQLHKISHENCFLANSIKTKININ